MFRSKSKNQMTSAIDLTTVMAPTSIVTEQIKTVKANINFTIANQQAHTIMVTSAMLGEGKSTISSNLAVEYAKGGLQVLLIDADLRRPTMHKTFNLRNQNGLSSWIGNQLVDINDVIQPVLDNLFVMTSGPKPPNPAELLDSTKMEELLTSVTRNLDLVIVDAPPVLPVVDAQLLANKVDGTVLVIRQNKTEKLAAHNAISALKKSQAKILGAVLNDVQSKENRGYSGYGYYSDEAE